MAYSDQLRDEIGMVDRHISELSGELTQARERLGQLEQLQSRMANLQESFESSQSERRSALQELQRCGLESRAVRGYATSMTALISGSPASVVSDDIHRSIQQLSWKIRDFSTRVHDLNASIIASRAHRRELEARMRRAAAEEQAGR